MAKRNKVHWEHSDGEQPVMTGLPAYFISHLRGDRLAETGFQAILDEQARTSDHYIPRVPHSCVDGLLPRLAKLKRFMDLVAAYGALVEQQRFCRAQFDACINTQIVLCQAAKYKKKKKK